MRTLSRMLLGAGTLLAAGSIRGIAQEQWEYRLTPYAFLSALDVDSTVAGQTTVVDMSFSDVLDTFDVLSLSARGEAWKGAYGGITDISYVKLDGNFGPRESVGVEIEEWFWDLLAAYRWIKPGNFTRPTTFDITGGLRIHGLKQEIRAAAVPTSLGGSDDWVDIMIGGRVIHPFAEKWVLTARGDIGGFGITDGTDLNWSVTGGLGWEFTRSWLLDFGYRVYGIDYLSGSGLQQFGIDGIEHGLWLGVTWAPVK